MDEVDEKWICLNSSFSIITFAPQRRVVQTIMWSYYRNKIYISVLRYLQPCCLCISQNGQITEGFEQQFVSIVISLLSLESWVRTEKGRPGIVVTSPLVA